MVKIQKPKPKSLENKNNAKIKPKLGKVTKALDVNPLKKKKQNELTMKVEGKSKKKNIVQKIVQNAKETLTELAVPVKKKKEKKESEQKSEKKPLVLAPKSSTPPALAKVLSNGKAKTVSAKKLKKEEIIKENCEAPVIISKKVNAPSFAASKQEMKKTVNAQKNSVMPVVKTKKVVVSPSKASKQKPNAKAKNVGQEMKKKQKQLKHIGPKTKSEVSRVSKREFQKNERIKRKNAEKGEPQKPLPMLIKFEATPFEEQKFNQIITVTNVEKVAKALKELVEKEVAKKKTSIFSDYMYIVNVCCFKIPNCPKRVVKLNVQHSLVDKDDDIVVIVPDLQRGAKVDYEPTIQHYEDIFREAGVEGLTIMPFNQLRTEYTTFEAKRKLSNTYDYFLCEGRIAGHAAGFCGKIFQKPRNTLHSVRLDTAKTIKKEVDKSLRRTAYRQLMKGPLTSIPVGTHKHTTLQIAENVVHVVEQLKDLYPGGLANIRNIHLKIDITGTSSLPIYISMAQPPEETPYVVGPREQRMLKLRKDANDVLSKFSVTKDANILRLSASQIERKRKIQETREVLKSTVDKKSKEANEPKPGKLARKENDKSNKANNAAKKTKLAVDKKENAADLEKSNGNETESDDNTDNNNDVDENEVDYGDDYDHDDGEEDYDDDDDEDEDNDGEEDEDDDEEEDDDDE